MSDLDCSRYNVTDPDISGIGVRISFYLQTFLLVTLVDRSWEDAPTALWTFIAMSFGLTIAAIIRQDSLTLFQALQVSNLVWLANFGTFIALASYSRQKAASRKRKSVRDSQVNYKEAEKRPKSDYGVKYGAMVQTIFSMALTLFMWSTAETFGPDPVSECSSRLLFAIFVIKAPALGAGKSAGLVFSSILTALYTLITLHELYSYFRTRQGKKAKLIPLANSPSTPRANVANGSHSPCSTSSAFPAERIKLAKYSRPGRRTWASSLDPMLIGITICQILIFTYFIVSNELLIRYNNSDGANFFGFGQILALVLVLPSFLSVVGAFREHGLARHATGRRKQHNVA